MHLQIVYEQVHETENILHTKYCITLQPPEIIEFNFNQQYHISTQQLHIFYYTEDTAWTIVITYIQDPVLAWIGDNPKR